MLAFWNPERELRAKELLYRCLEELGSTKAVLYLAGNEGSYELAASYGFGRRDALSAEIKAGHPLWDWVRRHRTSPAYLNDVHEAPALQLVLSSAGTSRLLTIPLSVGEHLVGLVDARDKARKAPFGPGDLPVARAICAALEDFLRDAGAYGDFTPETPAPPVSAPSPVVVASRTGESTGGYPHRFVVEETTAVLRSLASLPGLAAAALTVTDGIVVRVLVLRSVPLDQYQQQALAAHQTRVLAEAGVELPPPTRWGWDEQDSGGSEKRGDEIHTGILLAGPPVWIVLSTITRAAQSTGEAILAVVLRHLETSTALRGFRRAARNLARVLLEPGETSYPHLRQHAQATSEIAQRMAAVVGLSEAEEELVTVAAYLHDVGMRELDYNRIYRMERPGDVERRLYQRHPVVGARIVEGAEFPGDLSGAIRHHHERWDGAGYPQRLSGPRIPKPSRIIHIAEVYDTLTSPSSYRRPIGRESALDLIRAEAGKQFDPELVPALEEAVRT